MQVPGRQVPADRRAFLIGGLATLLASACARIPPRPTPTPPPSPPPEFDAWNVEARKILSEALEALQVFDDFQAFRIGITPNSGARLASELMWDPPTGSAWDAATRITRGLHGRADVLLRTIGEGRLDPELWRERRALADAAHDLVDLADALVAYRSRVDTLPPGDAAPALPLLTRAWDQFDAAAARWDSSRAEIIACT